MLLTVLNLTQLVLYIALLALAGQAVLYVLAGDARERNVFYRVVATIPRPFVAAVRWTTPRALGDRAVAWLTFLLLLIAYAAVTFEKIDLCVRVGLNLCR